MKALFDKETIYSIPDAKTVDFPDNFSGDAIIITSQQDINNGGEEKLSDILKSIKLFLHQNALLIKLSSNDNINLSKILSNTSKKVLVLCFGFTNAQLALQSHLTKYNIYNFENVKLIMVDPIQKIMSDKKLKGQLWNCIKKLEF